GGYRRQLQVIVDRGKLAAYGLSILDVRNAIDRFNVSRPGGTLTSDTREGIVRIDTRATSAEDVMNYPLAGVGGGSAPTGGAPASSGMGGGMGRMGGGTTSSSAPAFSASAPSPSTSTNFQSHPRVVYVRDVARVVDSYWERRSAYHFLDHRPGTEGEIV